jgi:hypothetical protein
MFSIKICVPLAPAATEGFEHVAPAGNPEHVMLTELGKMLAPTGVTESVYCALCPAFSVWGSVPLEIENVNSELNVAAAVCATCVESVPAPFTLKLYGCARLLWVVTVNAAPATVGVTGFGEIVHVGGTPPEQLRFTALAYPFNAFRVPLNVAEEFTVADCGELLIAS